MNSQGSAGVSQTIQAQFSCLSPALTIPDLLKRCLEPSRSWAGSAILRQRVQELHGELDTHTQSLETTPALLWGQFSSPSTQSKPRAKHWGCTNMRSQPDLSPAAFCSQKSFTHPSSFQIPSAWLVPLSLFLSLSLSEFVSLHRIKLPPFPAPQHQHFNSTRAIHVSRKVSMHASITYRTSRVLGDDTKHRGDHRTAHV